MGLIAAELEKRGIATVVINLLRVAAERVRPPRTLLVPFPHGYPLGRPNDPELQHRVLEAALRLVEDKTLTSPVLVEYESSLFPEVEPDRATDSG